MDHLHSAPSTDGAVRLEVHGDVATITLARPPVNALSASMQNALALAAHNVAALEDVRAVIVRGAGGVLSAGADIREMATLPRAHVFEYAARLQTAFLAVASIPQPVVAVIEGYALGGGYELALAADYRVASPGARIGLPEISLGVIPAAGGTQRLTRLVGPACAKDLIFAARTLTGTQAHEIGLVDRVVPDADLHAAASDWALQVARGPAAALRAAKKAIDAAAAHDLAFGLHLETKLFAGLFGTHDQVAGMRQFLQRRHGTPDSGPQ